MNKYLKHTPNLLSVIRLLMIPLFVYAYFNYERHWSAVIYIVAWATDVLDGFLARRFNWITDIGKFIDPLADKLMQIAAAACFSITDRIFLLLLIPTVIKELGMLIGGLIIIRRAKVVHQAHWYGKFASAALFVGSVAVMLFGKPGVVNTVICLLMFVVIIFATVMYYFKDFKGKYNLSFFKTER